MIIDRKDGDPPGMSHVRVFRRRGVPEKGVAAGGEFGFVSNDGRLDFELVIRDKPAADFAYWVGSRRNLPAPSIRDIAEFIRPMLRQGYKAALTRLLNGRDWRPNGGRNF